MKKLIRASFSGDGVIYEEILRAYNAMKALLDAMDEMNEETYGMFEQNLSGNGDLYTCVSDGIMSLRQYIEKYGK